MPKINTEEIVSKIEIQSKEYDLKFVYQEIENIDSEVREGIISFINCFDLFIVKVIKLSTSRKNITSSDINQNFINFFLGEEKSDLIEFLSVNKSILPPKYFIIFAFEWHRMELCRYKRISLNELRNYFSENNSWYLWLYDYSNDFEKPDLDIPLVLEVNNK